MIAPGDRRQVALAVNRRHPSAQEDAARRADELLHGRYDLLGYTGLTFQHDGRAVDWHFDPVHGRRAPIRFWSRVPYLDPRSGDHKIIWELNRHQHWLGLGRATWLTGDARYATAAAAELGGWLNANPPLLGINWSSMLELAFRAISWMWALHLFAEFDEPESPWLVDLLLGLDRQLDHVKRHLSEYFSPNTHLLGEGLALYVAGRVLPELKSSERWERAGRRILLRQAGAQVHSDGGHAELSTHYHRYALDFYLLAVTIARRTADPAAGAFADVASRLAAFCRAVADDEGHLPTIGDDDGGMLFPLCGRDPADARDSLGLAAVLLDRPDLAIGDLPEAAIWMLAGELPSTASHGEGFTPASRLFPETGYAVLRSHDALAIIDVGPHGFLNGGHAHADALSLVLSIEGRPLLIDPGTATYTMDRERRDRFRSTSMHNTVVIDGRGQAIPDGPFHWKTRACADVARWRSGRNFDYIEAQHDGYAPLVHRRAVLRGPDGLWLVADHILGTGRHDADGHWHLGPDWLLDTPDAPRASVTHRDGTRAVIASTARVWRDFYGDDDGLGWSSPVYGQLVPALTLRFSQTADTPFSWITAIAGGSSFGDLAVRSLEIASDRNDGWHRAGAVVTLGGSRALVLFATPSEQADERTTRTTQHMSLPEGELATDARAAILALSQDGRPRTLLVIESTMAQWTGAGAFRASPPPGEQDLHLDAVALSRITPEALARPGG